MNRPVVYISWSIRHGRSRDLAAALGAEAVYIGIRTKRRRWLTPLRYVACVATTVGVLLKRRPRAVFVMMPPLPLAVLAAVYGRLARVPVCLDAHTGAALKMRTGERKRSLEIVGRIATLVIVTNDELGAPLRDAGVRVVLLHDALPALGDPEAPSDFRVIAPLSWAADEPVEEVFAAAERTPEYSFVLTGRAPAAAQARTQAIANLELAGFLSTEAFDALVSSAGVVLALTTRRATMQRAGYEAIALGVPVIASGSAVLREFFGDAALYADDAAELSAAVKEVAGNRAHFATAMRARRDVVRDDFARGIAEVREAMRL